MINIIKPFKRSWKLVLVLVVIAALVATAARLHFFDLKQEAGIEIFKSYLNYSTDIPKAAEDQSQLGWRGKIELNGTDAVRKLTFYIVDKDSQSLNNLGVEAWLMQPGKKGMGNHINLTPRGNGVYEGELKFEHAGAWRLYVTATDGHNSYQTLQDVAVQ